MAKLCPKGKAAAKRKFKVYPSASANMYASGVCSGKITPGGKKGRKKAMGGGIAYAGGGKAMPRVKRAGGGPGLYANIAAKRARIKAGSGETMRKKGAKGAPTAANFKRAAQTAKS